MSKYQEYDAELKRLIGEGCNTFTLLSNRMGLLNKAIQPEDSWRVTDRRLQALRKKGDITYLNGSWHKPTAQKTEG